MQVDGEVLDPVSKDEAGDDVAVARFLRTCPGLSKTIAGDLLGQNNERCLRVLDAFCHMFDFSGAGLSLGFRVFPGLHSRAQPMLGLCAAAPSKPRALTSVPR